MRAASALELKWDISIMQSVHCMHTCCVSETGLVGGEGATKLQANILMQTRALKLGTEKDWDFCRSYL